ncbi:sugar phosphate isomerase/epimerase family protein [Fimbriimonas ginsengisoli]|uniref:Xylose isomerase n=1 Tax=Fimbriimonas ginsengisoli Gsoil 348 TaxID=661478 RepID=A0A068NWZ0_FIMGI|nr:TIM barrel protein [Fimbriimonas ginsengisoli]AIE87300.1 xylose isomerase [Fimbriimonas ginsengisoli Gsoil 348]
MESPRFNLTGFADEISPSIDEQVETLSRLGLSGLDLRGVDGINVLDLTLDHLEKILDKVHDAGLKISCVGSPVNKVKYDVMAQAREFDRLKRACYVAQRVNTKRIRIFTPEVPEGSEDELAPKVIEWMKEQRQLAKDQEVVLIHENDARFWGAYPENAKRMYGELGDSHFKAVYDFANDVLLGYRPKDWFPWLLPHLDTLHIKDAKAAERAIVPAGEGDAEIEETLRYLIGEGWNGNLTLEPHLQAAGPMGGFSGAQLFETAVVALRNVLQRAGGVA